MWTKEKVDLASELFRKGTPASKIAEELGAGMTRNAVIGKLNRLGITADRTRAQKVRPAPQRPLRSVSAGVITYKMPKVKARKVEPPKVKTGLPKQIEPLRVKLVDLRDHHCRFPLGNPGDPAFRFCGLDREGKSSYCEHHRRLSISRYQEIDANAV